MPAYCRQCDWILPPGCQRCPGTRSFVGKIRHAMVYIIGVTGALLLLAGICWVIQSGCLLDLQRRPQPKPTPSSQIIITATDAAPQ